MRLALYQCPSPAGDVGAGLAVIDTALAQAAGAGADMLVMPELFLPGYNASMARPPDWEETMARLRATVARHGLGLTIGLPEWDGETCYNAAFAFDGAGVELARYRKVQLYGARERALFSPGDGYCLFRFRGHVFGLLICYDVEFPEHTRALARAGAEAVLVPTANMQPFVNVNLALLPARAMESGLTIVYANYCGSEGDLVYVGRSCMSAPDGPPLACMGEQTGLLVADMPDAATVYPAPLSSQLADLRAPGTLKPPRPC